MKQGKVFFHPIEGSGQLSISWDAGPKGDAVEAKNGSGVGFFSRTGDLLSVLFDEVESSEDHQFLEFTKHKIEVFVKNGVVSFKVHKKKPFMNKLKRPVRTTRKSVLSKRKCSVKVRESKKTR